LERLYPSLSPRLEAANAQLDRSEPNSWELPIKRVGYSIAQGSRKSRRDRAMKLIPGGMVDMGGKNSKRWK